MSPTSPTTLADSPPADRLLTLPLEDWDLERDAWDAAYWTQPGILSLGWEAIYWAEDMLVQPNGPRAGLPFRFTPGQKRFLLWFYALDEAGQWLFHHAVRRLAKGTGKSPFAAILALIELCAPIRLDKIRDPDHRNPRKRLAVEPKDMAWVQIVATSQHQTQNIMRMVRAFAPKQDRHGRPARVVLEHGLDPGKTQVYKLWDEGKIEVITSSYVAAEGAEPSMVLADETQLWRPGNGGVELMATVADNAAKTGSRVLETCNAWKPGSESVAEATWTAWCAQEEGKLRAETRILYDARVAPPEAATVEGMSDPATLKPALEFVYADCSWKKPHRETEDGDKIPESGEPPEVRPIMARIHDITSRQSDSIRKYLNRPAAASDAWCDPPDWAILRKPRKVRAEEAVVLFFDGSKSGDATALVGCAMEDGYIFNLGVWERPVGEDGEGWEVPIAQVDARVERTFDNHEVVAFYADVREWESFVHTTWPQRYKERLIVWAQPSGKNAGPIAWDMRTRSSDFTLATEACKTEIKDREFAHDGDPAVARHIANARMEENRYGVTIRKESPDSPLKIDAATCVIGARLVRRHVLSSVAWKKWRRKTGKAGFF